jgi:hypothetical protein
VNVVQGVMAVCMAASKPVWVMGEPTEPPPSMVVDPNDPSRHVEPNGSRPNGSRHKVRHKCEHCGKGFLAQKNARFCSHRCNGNWYYAKVVRPGIQLKHKEDK